MTTLFWFRNDLRLSDNLALAEATKSTDNLIPIFILDNKHRPLGAAQQWWLHHSLASLQNNLNSKGINLLLKKGDSKKILTELIQKHNVKKIYWNKCYEPQSLKTDSDLEKTFASFNVDVKNFNSSLLTEPQKIKNKSGGYFKIFTPYWKHIHTILKSRKTLHPPRNFSQKIKFDTEHLDDWRLLPTSPDWSKGFKIWSPGEKGAHTALRKFIKYHLENYSIHRDRPDISGTSCLSPYLHFGEISIHQVWNAITQAAIDNKKLQKPADVFLRQLVWREFAYYLLHHYPELDKKNFNKKFNGFKWEKNKKWLCAWQKGLTGYPIIDAGMRELWHTGYMHNRVRMIVASFLTKDLRIDWREGEKWFWDTLLDADVANNALGWQWVAGSGPDAAPYFRIFNPILQGKKFDPDGTYIKRWIPELSELPTKYIHYPANAPEHILQRSQIKLDVDYPAPIVCHSKARKLALNAYRNLKTMLD